MQKIVDAFQELSMAQDNLNRKIQALHQAMVEQVSTELIKEIEKHKNPPRA